MYKNALSEPYGDNNGVKQVLFYSQFYLHFI